jgi:hypothetical protein
MKYERMLPASATVLLASLSTCAPAVPEGPAPANTSNAFRDLQPVAARLVSEAAYTLPGRTVRIGFSPGIGPIVPTGPAGTSRTSFYTDEGVVAVADITWSDPASSGGTHIVDWQLFRDNLMLKEKRTDEKFFGKPARILSHISANSFPPGHYRVELMVDQKPFAILPFSILATEAPAPLAVAVSGPDCTAAMTLPSTIMPLSPIRPNFPEALMDRGGSGCAFVSIILDNSGRPSGLRVDGEYPKNSGFGRAATQAILAAVFPAGHGGETTHMTIRFRSVR